MFKNSWVNFLIFFLIGLVVGAVGFRYYIFSKLGPILEYAPPTITIGKPTVIEEGDWSLRHYNTKRVEVDLKSQKLILFGDGKKIKEISISSGKEGSPTPTGSFRVITKSEMIYSKPTHCWLPFWVGFTPKGGYGFHEVPICQGKRQGLEEIGKPASLGCIRLSVNDAEKFYNFAEIGMPITIK